jgi:hypothetical protein
MIKATEGEMLRAKGERNTGEWRKRRRWRLLREQARGCGEERLRRFSFSFSVEKIRKTKAVVFNNI